MTRQHLLPAAVGLACLLVSTCCDGLTKVSRNERLNEALNLLFSGGQRKMERVPTLDKLKLTLKLLEDNKSDTSLRSGQEMVKKLISISAANDERCASSKSLGVYNLMLLEAEKFSPDSDQILATGRNNSNACNYVRSCQQGQYTFCAQRLQDTVMAAVYFLGPEQEARLRALEAKVSDHLNEGPNADLIYAKGIQMYMFSGSKYAEKWKNRKELSKSRDKFDELFKYKISKVCRQCKEVMIKPWSRYFYTLKDFVQIDRETEYWLKVARICVEFLAKKSEYKQEVFELALDSLPESTRLSCLDCSK